MDRTVCGLDRAARFVAGPALVLAAVWLRRSHTPASGVRRLATLGVALWGIEITLTALARWCPAYYVLGVDTCEAGWAATYRQRFGPAPEDGAITAQRGAIERQAP